MKTIVLASASPRRKELLEQIGVNFQVQPACGAEIITKVKPKDVVEELSVQKAMEVADKICRQKSEQEKDQKMLVIGSDTIVSYDNKIMGKPADREDAVMMLQKLSGNTHQVYTGVTAVLCKNGEKSVRTFSERTEVTFYPLSREEIEAYVSTGEPMDKAGAYGIQGIGGKFVKSIHGDYNNVVGLPVARLYQEILKEWMN